MTDEKLCLKWNDFQDIVQTSFAELRGDNDFTDVTLACEGRSIKAHKVILSASSPFFKRLLKTHTHPQPLIYMRGMSANDLTAMVDFIYLGEASVFQEQLENFLALAEELELKGLKGSSEENDSEYTKEYTKEQYSHNMGRAESNQKQIIPERSKISSDKYEDSMVERKMVPIHTKENSIIRPDTMAQIQSMIEKRTDGYFCTNCDYRSGKLCHLKEHVEKHIQGLEYPCNVCCKTFRSSASLRIHIVARRCSGVFKR